MTKAADLAVPAEALPAPGWYADPESPKRLRWWTGAEWPVALSVDERRDAFAKLVALEVRRGWRVEVQSDLQAVLVRGQKPNHLLHFLISVLTIGLWVIVWFILSVSSKIERTAISVDQQGRALT